MIMVRSCFPCPAVKLVSNLVTSLNVVNISKASYEPSSYASLKQAHMIYITAHVNINYVFLKVGEKSTDILL